MNRLASLAPTLILAVPSLAAPVLAGDADPCAQGGHCYLSPWFPDAAVGGEEMGESVDLDGDTAAVGLPGAGTVQIYQRAGSTWSLVQTLPDPNVGDNDFGAELRLAGDVLAIGAPLDGTQGLETGAVHVFERDAGGVWSHDQTLYEPTPSDGAHFGVTLDVDGPWLAVGSPNEPGVGQVHTYLRSPDDWLQWETLSGQPGTLYGSAVDLRAISDPVGIQMVVGIPEHDVAVQKGGAVQFHTRTLGGSMHMQLYYPPGLQPFDRFGSEVALDGDYFAVGAEDDDTVSYAAGAVYVVDIEPIVMGPNLSLDEKLLPCGEQIDSFGFGHSLDLRAGRLAVGNEIVSLWGKGAAYVYCTAPFGGWDIEDRLTNNVSDDRFARDVALGDDVLLAGAPLIDTVGFKSGAAYFFSLAPKSFEQGPCPCDSLAGMESYGAGKAGSVGMPELSASSAPIPGDLTLVRLTNALLGSAPFLIWGLTQAALPLDGGTLLVGDPHFHFLPIVSVLGQVGAPWNVPANPALCGLDVFIQAMFLDPGAAGPFSTAQSNGLRLTVGY